MATNKPAPAPAAAESALVAAPAGPNDPARIDALRLGEVVQVQVAAGQLLRNNETGTLFPHGAPVAQTVTVTLLRRLRDGDLVLL